MLTDLDAAMSPILDTMQGDGSLSTRDLSLSGVKAIDQIADEPLAYWRETYYEKYNSLLDSLRMSDSLDIEDPVLSLIHISRNTR